MQKFLESTIGSNIFWSWVGKIAVVVGILAGIVEIYKNINSTQPQVEARCNLSAILREPQAPKIINREPLKDGVPQPLENFRDSRNETHPFADWLFPRHYLRCIVSNSGSREAKDVVIDAPYSIFATVINKKSNIIAPTEYINSINIGVLRPKARIEVTAWTRDSAASEPQNEDGYSLSHSEGIGIIKLPYLAYGKTAKFAKLWDESSGWLLLPIGFITTCFFLLPSYIDAIRKRKKNIEPS